MDPNISVTMRFQFEVQKFYGNCERVDMLGMFYDSTAGSVPAGYKKRLKCMEWK